MNNLVEATYDADLCEFTIYLNGELLCHISEGDFDDFEQLLNCEIIVK